MTIMEAFYADMQRRAQAAPIPHSEDEVHETFHRICDEALDALPWYKRAWVEFQMWRTRN